MNSEVFLTDRRAANLKVALLFAMDESGRAWEAFEAAELKREVAGRELREYLVGLEGGLA